MNCLPISLLILLGALTAIGPLSIDMYLPAFPAIEYSLTASPGSIDFTLASFCIGMAVGQLVYGPLIDHYGRLQPLLMGLAIYTLATAGCTWADSMNQLIIWRFLEALGAGVGIVTSRAIVRDRCATHEAAGVFSMLILVIGLAPMVAPLLGGWVSAFFGWRAVFGVLALYAAALWVVAYFRLPETHTVQSLPPLQLNRVFAHYGKIVVERPFIGYALMASLVYAGMLAYIAGSPFVMIKLYHIRPENFGWVFGCNAVGLMVGSQINARLLKRYPLTHLLRIAVWVPCLSGGLLAALAWIGWLPLPWVLAGFFFYVTSVSFVGPNAIASALAHHGKQAGMASAVLGATQFLLATLAGSLVGFFHDNTAKPLMTVMALCGFGVWLAHHLKPSDPGESVHET